METMTPPEVGATARPWSLNGGEIQGDIDDTGYTEVALCNDLEDAAFIVYAVNHIEATEVRLAEAERLLHVAAYRTRTTMDWRTRARAFLARAGEQEGAKPLPDSLPTWAGRDEQDDPF